MRKHLIVWRQKNRIFSVFVAVVLIACLIFPSFALMASAQVEGTGDAGITSTYNTAAAALVATEIAAEGRVPIAAPGVLKMLEAGTTAQLALSTYHENVSRPYKALLRDVIVKRITDMMTDMIIRWAQSGFQGAPLFVSDWKQFLNQAADVAFDSVNDAIMNKWGLNLCAPFAPQLQLQLIGLQKYYGDSYSQDAIPKCTISGFEQNLQNTADYFKTGKWLSFEQVSDPNNTFIGVSMQVTDQYLNQMNQEQQSRQNEARASAGFLSQKTCVAYATPNDTSSPCTQWDTQTPGTTVANSINEAFTVGKYNFTTNIQSIVAAIINGAISVLMNYIQQGLASATSNFSQTTNYGQLLNTPLPPTTPPGSASGTPPTPPSGTDTTTAQILQNYTDFSSYYNPVLAVYSQTLAVLTATASSCPDLVSSTTTQALQSQIATVTQALSDAQTNSSQIGTASSSDVVAAWGVFSTTYADLWSQVTADATVGANSVLSSATVDLQNAQALQQQCSSR